MNEKRYLKALIEYGPENWAYNDLKKAFEMGREASYEEISASGLVGRGGAAFPTATKWCLAREHEDVVLICNADEGEPGTFKDRYIMENNPALLLEGMLISAYILGASEVYIYIRGEYVTSIANMEREIDKAGSILEAYKEKTGSAISVQVVKGQGAYVCGDETSMINSIEGVRPNSRIKPPYPTEEGLFGKPTVVNNVETLCNVPLIIKDGGAYYATLGVEGSRGTKLMCLSGRINNPGVYEIEFGKVTYRELIHDFGGGIINGNKFKFVIPGGISTQLLVEDEIDVPIDYASLREIGSALGSGAVIVADDTVNTVDVANNVSDFFMKETCGICFPCKEGNRQIHHLLKKISMDQGKADYLDLIKDVSATTTRAARCGLGQSAGNLIESAIDKLREDFDPYFK